MKELTLIRHAKSDWAEAGLDDHDRPLNDRGRRDAPRMGHLLLERGLGSASIVSSTALRARSTAEAIASEWGRSAAEIQLESALYLARPDEILNVVRRLDESAGSVVLFGHNPGIHEAAYLFLKPAETEKLGDFPTCAVARLRLPVDFWGNAAFGEAELVEYLTPKGSEP